MGTLSDAVLRANAADRALRTLRRSNAICRDILIATKAAALRDALADIVTLGADVPSAAKIVSHALAGLASIERSAP